MKLSRLLFCVLVLSISVSAIGTPKRSGPSASTELIPWWGYIDKTGKIVIQPQYSDAGGFVDGLAPVKVGWSDEGRWGYIDKSGKFIWKDKNED